MLTDWVLISRLAAELRERLRGARVDDAGLLADGRIALVVRSRGARMLLAFDLFSSPPLVTLEEGELGIASEPSFVRSLARALRGMVLDDASARRGDRLLRLSFTSRSRFGIGDRIELYLELVPRFGNAVLVKEGTVVAAYREFAPSQNPRRAVQAGLPYELPPLPSQPRTLDVQPAGSVLDTFAAFHAAKNAKAGNERAAAQRKMLLKRLDTRARKLREELGSLADKRARAAARDELRTQGEAIFSNLYELDPEQREEAKDRAAKLFSEYKKLAKSLPHIDARERVPKNSLEVLETLRWEAERASDEDLDGVHLAVAQLEGKRAKRPTARPPKRKRALLEYRTDAGSRIIVGRSPVENAELTFRIARPNDLWFHAQRTPGAHVILARDDREPVPEQDLRIAASLAALHSRARAATSVAVDYTLCKHVRKQRAAPPGLVWYTDARTIVARPADADRAS
jgi:predicted ribosome quality control (RQC) complex YloA/Tae2 family protein